MENLLKVLKNEGFISKEILSDLEEETDLLKKQRKELIELLDSNREERIELYEDQINKELGILEEIKKILAYPTFERIYQDERNKNKIDKLLEPLNNNDIEILKGSRVLKNIRHELLVLLDEQNYLEKNKLKEIENDLGEKIWEEFMPYFQKDSFLKIIMGNENFK